MLFTLLIGAAVLLACLAIQLVAVIAAVRRVVRRIRAGTVGVGFGSDFLILGEVLMVLVVGNLLQVFIWAAVFMLLGEFSDFATAFYHSMVNFATLGYGDIVMSERWRLLGALEAGSGVAMFGLTTGAVMATLGRIIQRHGPVRELQDDEQ